LPESQRAWDLHLRTHNAEVCLAVSVRDEDQVRLVEEILRNEQETSVERFVAPHDDGRRP